MVKSSKRAVFDWPLQTQYALAVGAVLVAVAVRFALTPAVGSRFPFFTIFVVLVPLAFVVRLTPLLTAAIIGTVASTYFFLEPVRTLRVDAAGWLQVVLFLVSLSVVILTAWHSRRTRDRLLRADAMLRAFVDDSPTSKWVTDPQGRIVYANRSMAAAVGRPLDDILGRTHAEVLAPAIAAAASEHVRAVRETGVARTTVEEIDTNGSGTSRILEWRRFPLRFGANDAVFVAGMANDITEKWNTESALKASVKERERLLESERAARIEAEQATRVKDEFLAALSHELRTPLNAILGWIRLIEKDPADKKMLHDGIPIIARNAKVQMDLIGDLLDTSRIISGRIRLDLKPVDLAEVVAAAVESIQPVAQSRGIRIARSVEPFGDPVLGDDNRLQQIVWNLLSNAVKFTPRGGRIDVRVEKNGGSARITVSNTGEGIDPAFLPHLFERFRQADASNSRRFVGLGLGLAIVKHLVELHGGTVRADSDGDGKGSIFSVDLPLAQPNADLTVVAENEVPAYVPEVIDLSGVEVLAVEDHPDALDLLKRMLEERHAHVLTAVCADDALAVVRTTRPDVLISDIAMPGKDGYDLIRELRQANDDTPAIAVTAFARSEDATRAIEAGYQAHVSKPVDENALVAAVSALARCRLDSKSRRATAG